jgi:branched-chain amino acid aminotransferase
MGLKVERRSIEIGELSSFEEAGACGTAAVISPIGQIDDLGTGQSFVYSKDGEAGPISTQLYKRLQAIQTGDMPDTHGWIEFVD